LPEELSRLSPKDNEPARGIILDLAIQYAELVGKRIPDEGEYEFAATNAGTTSFPWGDDGSVIKDWKIGPTGTPEYDRCSNWPTLCGLYSGVGEWTISWHVPYPGAEGWTPQMISTLRKQRIVRGAPFWAIAGASSPPPGVRTRDARFRQGIAPDDARPGLGFRCVRSLEPHFPRKGGKS
jgi:formylglycine-generating enzyme required for sulfatase activity